MNWQDHIEQRPDVMLGKPAIKGPGIYRNTLYE